MIKSLFVMLVIGTLIGCSPAERPVETSAVEETSAATREPDRYQEYLWCHNGPNYSKESFDASISYWLELVEQSDLPAFGNFSIFPIFNKINLSIS